ncbi:hypothetical protein B5V00_03510 [Geothermobacter hydrogeniphilus]|uniref:SGNH hydrolase-type esterase domain-containing protein n=2 Tax=Geothermobacter hydrogeniphilus TaxID=1969733 RepID=A0A1X0YB70_9BACT|nr:hypothetical protein B5V00_03510 [Geothermobacter hydrogeniphilus]
MYPPSCGMRRSRRKRIAVMSADRQPLRVIVPAILFGILVFWGAGEVGIRLLTIWRPQYDVEMWKYAERVKVVSNHPGMRFEHRPGVCEILMGVEVCTNSDGLRDREHSPEPDSAHLRIAILGDSITFGWGVPQRDAYPALLEKTLAGVKPGLQIETLNFGVGNYNSVDELAMLKNHALDYRPDMVLVGVFLNDAEPSRALEFHPLLKQSAFAVWLWGRLDALQRRLGLRKDFDHYYEDLFQADSSGFKEMQSALREMISLCRRRGIPIVFVMLPELHDLARDEFADIRLRLRRLIDAAGAEFIDLRPALPQSGGREFWVSAEDPHPNILAHRLYADELARRLPETLSWQEAVTFMEQRRGTGSNEK